VHGPPDSLALVGAAGRVLGRRAVFDLHDSAPELFAAKFGDGLVGGASRALAGAQRAAVLSADLVIVTNESQRRLASALGGARVAVVRNGPRAAEFARPLPSPRPGTLREPHLVYVGALDVQDGVLELPELLTDPALRGARLTVVGDGPMAAELAARCEQLELDGRVALLGQVPHEQVPALIAAADIGVDPAPGTELNHGSTMIKVAEYLAVGRPVVAYRLRETERTALDAGVYAPCGDRRAFAELVRSLADDGARRLALSERARNRSAELMWEHSAQVLCDAYADLV
jgi:glycosyltransferase involved in cell wall biosynthesis